jgi:2-polyprenyl-3-methyl-5-hydroxy-6-metoxy-1,4-benzoquinol methylase
MSQILDFPPCVICGADDWGLIYGGPVRDGSFGSSKNAEVRRCSGCGVDRLAESACLSTDSYKSTEYRERLGQDHDIDRHYAAHDELARFTLDTLWPASLRGKNVADLGCGGGALLDHLRGIAGVIIAIDPAFPFADSLKARGYEWFASAEEACRKYAGKVDFVLSTQVIEHVEDPRKFLLEAGRLLKPDGTAIVSTPNRRDVLMELLPEVFPAFFYRVQHRWAFDAASLIKCAQHAGLSVAEVRHVHRYGLSNTLYWLKERKPRGRTLMPPVDAMIDKLWQAWLENNGRADNLYLILKRAAPAGEALA